MSDTLVPLSELEIVGYADVLSKDMVPFIVPPVFRFKDSEKALLPPFDLVGAYVVDGVPSHISELQRLEEQRRITLLDTVIHAEAEHQLWLDEAMNPQYEPQDDAADHLQEKSLALGKQAIAAFKEGDQDTAARLAAQALAADDTHDGCWALVAAMHRLNDREEEEELITESALTRVLPDLFEEWVSYFVNLVSEGTPAMEDLDSESKGNVIKALFGTAA